jgi:hypothetical protein
MKIPSMKALVNLILQLNWQGHVELPISDVEWFAKELHGILTGRNAAVCEVCNTEAIIIVRTPLGPICADCLEDFNQEVEARRQA